MLPIAARFACIPPRLGLNLKNRLGEPQRLRKGDSALTPRIAQNNAVLHLTRIVPTKGSWPTCMEQTREAINHSRAANVPIMVAVNKMDKPGAEPDRVLRELAELGLQAEEWGGDTIVAKVSAKSRMCRDA